MASNIQKTGNNLKEIDISFQTNNLIVTPLTCSTFVMDFIRLLVYEKLQIPYPYSWLKATVNRRKEKQEFEDTSKVKPVDRYYKIALSALEFLEDLSRQLHWQFIDENIFIEEVALSFGTNLACPTETYCLHMPKTTPGHIEGNHLSEMNKTVNKMLRNLMLSNEWLNVTESNIPPTNMYVLIKKRQNKEEIKESDYFLPKDLFRIPVNTKRVNIKIDNSKPEKQELCCSNLHIFEDSADKEVTSCYNGGNQCEIKNVTVEFGESQWFLAKSFLKGYKDTFINNKSVSNIW